MELSLADCLKLPSFKGAKVVAGKSGLSHAVDSCSVLEWTNVDEYRDIYFRKNELVITSFYSVRNDIDAQCEIIRYLSKYDTAGILHYYTGVILDHLDSRVIETAEQLDYPLIVMPDTATTFSCAIGDVMESLFLSKIRQNQVVSLILQQFSALRDEQRNYTELLRLLSDHMNCTLVLCDFNLNPVACWCDQDLVNIDIGYLIAEANQQRLLENETFPFTISISNRQFLIDIQQVPRESAQLMLLLFVSSRGNLDLYLMQQAAEVISAAEKIWGLNEQPKKNKPMLLRTLLGNNKEDAVKMTTVLEMSREKWSTFFYILPDDLSGDQKSDLLQSKQLIKVISDFFLEQHRHALIDTMDRAVVVLVKDSPYQELENDIVSMLDSRLQAIYLRAHIVSAHLHSLTGIQEIYASICKSWDHMIAIHPHRRLFKLEDVQLASICTGIIEQERGTIKEELEQLQPLFKLQSSQKQHLLDTLEVFLLDANKNVGKTAQILYIHSNTVKYRLKQIQGKLGQNIFDFPEVIFLYFAMAVRRITNSRDKKDKAK